MQRSLKPQGVPCLVGSNPTAPAVRGSWKLYHFGFYFADQRLCAARRAISVRAPLLVTGMYGPSRVCKEWALAMSELVRLTRMYSVS